MFKMIKIGGNERNNWNIYCIDSLLIFQYNYYIAIISSIIIKNIGGEKVCQNKKRKCEVWLHAKSVSCSGVCME